MAMAALALMPALRVLFILLIAGADVSLGALIILLRFLFHHLPPLLSMPMRGRLIHINGPHHRLHHEIISTSELDQLGPLPLHEADHPLITVFSQPMRSDPLPTLHLEAAIPSLLFDGLPRHPAPHYLEQYAGDGSSPTCSICLDPFRHCDEVRRLPCCGHVFHTACIDVWILRRCRQACPLCRALLNLNICQPKCDTI
ncbi:hypothetical protein GOP47_0004455 [Adiantum capillus-veneris]|uniref:RING-type domain-containing protein n=1 Tax=Adiantum capillus-veneris TaxID=13818 RepID=A0A9D4V844_ADICA|nr:hypothetical protein GOP47_0004455 [Adiantum capillus-veneris]